MPVRPGLSNISSLLDSIIISFIEGTTSSPVEPPDSKGSAIIDEEPDYDEASYTSIG
jgi:hypothetical protein